MQINSVSNTNFGLTIHPSLENILNKSKKEIAKQSKRELGLWERDVEALKKIKPDDYTISVKHDKDLSEPYILLKCPDGSLWSVNSIGKDSILDRNAITEIKKRLRDLFKFLSTAH